MNTKALPLGKLWFWLLSTVCQKAGIHPPKAGKTGPCGPRTPFFTFYFQQTLSVRNAVLILTYYMPYKE